MPVVKVPGNTSKTVCATHDSIRMRAGILLLSKLSTHLLDHTVLISLPFPLWEVLVPWTFMLLHLLALPMPVGPSCRDPPWPRLRGTTPILMALYPVSSPLCPSRARATVPFYHVSALRLLHRVLHDIATRTLSPLAVKWGIHFARIKQAMAKSWALKTIGALASTLF